MINKEGIFIIRMNTQDSGMFPIEEMWLLHTELHNVFDSINNEQLQVASRHFPLLARTKIQSVTFRWPLAAGCTPMTWELGPKILKGPKIHGQVSEI